MIKLKVQYTSIDELKRVVINPLKPYITSLKYQPAKGKFERCYIFLDEPHEPRANREKA